MNGWARPSRPAAPAVVAAAVLGLWWLVAHNGGSGWVQALGDVVFGTLFIGIFGPGVILLRATVTVSHAPTDGVVGTPFEVTFAASTRLRICARAPFKGEVFVGPTGRTRRPEDRVLLTPQRRGVYRALPVDIVTAAPFAMQWWTRRVVVFLPSPLHVAPRPGRPESLPLRSDEDAGATIDWVQTDIGDPRGARPYRPGDSRRRVHWSATAHAGELMVRELERPAAEPVTVRVVLPPDPEEAERTAERALGTIQRLLERGALVVLSTTEATGPVTARVADRRGAGRRMACAVPQSGSSSSVAVTPRSR
jgi:uncharacterized protein (DUF58 family)